MPFTKKPKDGIGVRTLTGRELNRAALARQLLLDRAEMPLTEALQQIGGIQTQYAPSGYVGLWTRLRDFRRDALTDALVDRSAVQATLLRATIHVVARSDFWPCSIAIREARRTWALRLRPERGEAAMIAAAEALRRALADGPKSVKELGGLADGFLGHYGVWVDTVRVPPSGTWERRRADRLALAEQWMGPPPRSHTGTDPVELDEALAHIVRAYLRAFGPARWADIASWAGIPVGSARRGGAVLTLEHYRDESGRELVDLPGAPLPDAGTPAPVRFLPHWDALLLVHARRTGVLPEEVRARVFSSRNPFSVGTYLVDGRVAGAWTVREGRVVLDPVTPLADLSPADRAAVEAEREALEAFHA